MSRAFAVPLATLVGAALLGSGAWLIHGEEASAAGPGADVAVGATTAGKRPPPAIPAPRTGFDPANTDYAAPLDVVDPPAGHAGRRVAMDAPADVPGSD